MFYRSVMTVFTFYSIILVCSVGFCFAGISSDHDRLTAVVSSVQEEIKLEKGDKQLLCLTNADYGRMNGQSAEYFLDILSSVTGCTIGQRSLLSVHSSTTSPLWFSLYSKESGMLIYMEWAKDAFNKQEINISPDSFLQPQAWKAAASGIIGKSNLFKIASISLAWSGSVPWEILKASEFHNHICPGLNVGYRLSEYVKSSLPLKKNEKYIFIFSPPFCAADMFQTAFDTTVGKLSMFSRTMNKKMQAKYSGDLWYENAPGPPLTPIVLRVNKKDGSFRGTVLGFDWTTLYGQCAFNYHDLLPPGKKSNPVFYVSRIKLTLTMLALDRNAGPPLVKELKQFSGDKKLAGKLTHIGSNPYEIIWDLK